MVGLHLLMVEVSSGRSMGRKLSRGGLGPGRLLVTAAHRVSRSDLEHVFSDLSDFFGEKAHKVFNAEICRDRRLNLAMVLNKKCGLFLLTYIKDE